MQFDETSEKYNDYLEMLQILLKYVKLEKESVLVILKRCCTYELMDSKQVRFQEFQKMLILSQFWIKCSFKQEMSVSSSFSITGCQ